MLIENIETAIKSVKEKAKYFNIEPIFDNDFFEFILPYRTSIEPLQNWRNTYYKRFKSLINKNDKLDSQMLQIDKNIYSWFTNTYRIEDRGEPLPRLGGSQLINRAKGACEDIGGLGVFIARSQGFASAVDFVPSWATASGVHFLNYLSIPNNPYKHYDVSNSMVLDTFIREPGKVLRTTYSKQVNTLAANISDTSLIPNSFLRTQNYIDVTNEYWKTATIKVKLFPNNNNITYLSVWNYAQWQPVWFSKETKNDTAIFTNMSKGVIYMPMNYKSEKYSVVGNPIIHDFDTTYQLQPDTLTKRKIVIKEQKKYLAFRPGSKYSLFYWLGKWNFIGTKVADKAFTELEFENVPTNVVLLLMPDYSQGKDRVFIIDKMGNRKYY